jgi:hypothetical protein
MGLFTGLVRCRIAGALVLLPPGVQPAAGGLQPLPNAKLSARIHNLPRQSLALGAPKRMSMAGAQHKRAVVVRDGELYEPVGLTASCQQTDHSLPTQLTRAGSQTDQHRQLTDHLTEGRLSTQSSRSRKSTDRNRTIVEAQRCAVHVDLSQGKSSPSLDGTPSRYCRPEVIACANKSLTNRLRRTGKCCSTNTFQCLGFFRTSSSALPQQKT